MQIFLYPVQLAEGFFAYAQAEDAARQVDQGVDEVATAAVSNIDEAAEQAQGFIGAAQERVEGAFDEAPRQAASVVQQVMTNQSTADSTYYQSSSIRGCMMYWTVCLGRC